MSNNALQIGDEVPDVAGTDQDGEKISLAAYCESGYAIVFFYPKAETPGCVKQACSLRDAFAELSEQGVKVLGVSADKVAAQKRFHEKRALPYPLIADAKKELISAFGVPTLLGVAKRQAFLFKDGKLVWKDEKASTSEQAEDALQAISELEQA